MQRFELTTDEKRTLNWYVTKVLWLKQRLESGETGAATQIDDAEKVKTKLERSIRDRLGLHWMEPLNFDGEFAVVK